MKGGKGNNQKFFFIVNPVAGRGRAKDVANFIKKVFEVEKKSYDLRFTDRQKDVEHYAREAIQNKSKCIVAVGGDGTVSELINSTFGEDITYGIVPVGSGNDFSKACGIPVDPYKAVNVLLRGNERKVDVGCIGDLYFINGLGIGLDGAVAHRFRTLRFLGGFIGYLVGAIFEAAVFSGFESEMKVGEYEFEGKLLLCGASNGSFQGGKFKIAPEASVSDGLLDFHIVKNMSPLSRLKKMPLVLKGSHTNLEEVHIIKAERALVTVDRDIPAHIDGEPFVLKRGKHEISVRKKAISVIIPEK